MVQYSAWCSSVDTQGFAPTSSGIQLDPLLGKYPQVISLLFSQPNPLYDIVEWPMSAEGPLGQSAATERNAGSPCPVH